MKKITGRFIYPLPVIISICAAVLAAACSSERIDTPLPPTPVPEQRQLSPEYMREGFINRDTFRVVLVITPDEAAGMAGSIESRARVRAMATLRDYINGRGWHYNNRVQLDLMRLITSNGRGSLIDRTDGRDSLYVYDVSGADIQTEVAVIATRR